jgi:hypothetical protein
MFAAVSRGAGSRHPQHRDPLGHLIAHRGPRLIRGEHHDVAARRRRARGTPGPGRHPTLDHVGQPERLDRLVSPWSSTMPPHAGQRSISIDCTSTCTIVFARPGHFIATDSPQSSECETDNCTPLHDAAFSCDPEGC